MRKKTLGRTNYQVTQLGYGALEVRGTSQDDARGRMPNEDRADQVLNAVLDSGINFIDTAWCYGRSEEMMGKYISKRRDEYVLAAKTGHGRCSADNFASYNRKDMLECLEESLRNLGTDHLDIVQLHNPTAEDVEENGSIETLQEIKARGLTKFIGVSSVLPHLEKHLATGGLRRVPDPLLGAGAGPSRHNHQDCRSRRRHHHTRRSRQGRTRGRRGRRRPSSQQWRQAVGRLRGGKPERTAGGGGSPERPSC